MLSTFYQEILFIRKSLSTAKFVVENEKHKMIEDNLFYKYLLIQLMTRFSGSQKQRMHFGKQFLTFARNKLFISHPGWLILIKTMCNIFSLLSIDRASVPRRQARSWEKWNCLGSQLQIQADTGGLTSWHSLIFVLNK